MQTLEDIVRSHVYLQTKTSQGWYQVACKVCNDHTRKGLRAGFKFEHNTVAYHCFNCGISAFYSLGEPIGSEKTVEVFNAFGIPEQALRQGSLEQLTIVSPKQGHPPKQIDIEPKEVELPKTFYYLKDADVNDKWRVIAEDYLEHKRGIDPASYNFMLSQRTNNPLLKRWYGRLIIPIYKDGKLVFYFGRALTRTHRRYINVIGPKNTILYGFDKLFENNHVPLYVVEGWFDGFVIGGVAIMGNSISTQQIEWLNKSQRKKVYIPDRAASGLKPARQSLNIGWAIATPDIGQCKDINEAVVKYGRLYVIEQITKTTTQGPIGHIPLNLYCKG